jgi:hypothetical protein
MKAPLLVMEPTEKGALVHTSEARLSDSETDSHRETLDQPRPHRAFSKSALTL